MLPDKTEVILNSGSYLRLEKGFGKTHRNVHLSGDAYFNIPNGSRPFIVYTPHLILTTASASLKVNAYAGQAGEETLVFSGHVKAVKVYYSALDHDPYFLQASDMVMMNKDIDLMEKERFEAAEWTPWVEGKLSFADVSLNDLVNRLKNWFNADIEVYGKPPANLRYTGIFPDPSLKEILDTVGRAWNFRYNVRANAVALKF